VLAAGALAAAGCGDTPPTASQLYHPSAFHPEDFPDIPLVAVSGYMLAPGVDQLAVSYAGGTVRRFEVTMQTRPGVKDEDPVEVLTRYDTDLPRTGWTRIGALEDGVWRKDAEELRIEVTDSDDTTTVAFHLRPCTPSAPGAGTATAASLAGGPNTVPGPASAPLASATAAAP
jgi:hypothetical protein